MRIIVFDIESRLWAEDLDKKDKEHGWELLRQGKGGASAIALYDSYDDWVSTYDDHEIEACARHIEQADLLVGYNSEGFDLPVMEGIARRQLRIRKHFDIYNVLAATCAARGIKTGKGDLTLDRIAKKNLGRGKIEHGSNAKELAQRGHWGRLFRYCSSDVQLTRDLYLKLVKDGGLIGPTGFITLRVPGHS